MSLQVHAWRAMSSMANAATNFISPINGQLWSAVEFEGSCYCTAAGSFSNWQIVLPTAPGSGKSFVFTLRVNGADTGATITISNTATVGTYTGAAIALADGDKIGIKCVPSGTPAVSTMHCAWSFNSTTANESIYGCGGQDSTFTTTRTNTFFFRPDVFNFQTLTTDIASCPGTVTKITIELSIDSGAGGSWTFVVNKNGVAQDGTSGTPDTRVTFNNTGVVKSATFSMSVAAGDRFSWTVTPTGSPSLTPKIINGIRFVATNPGESMMGGCTTGTCSTTATNYTAAGNGSKVSPSATEADWQVNVGLTPFKLKNLYVGYSSTVGASAPAGYDDTIRKNGSGTALTVSPRFTDTQKNVSSTIVFNKQDLLGIQSTPTATAPTSRILSWSGTQTQQGGGNAGGNSNNGKKGGGGGVTVQNAGGASFLNIGNTGLDVGVGS